jgi:hypothetical protein
VRGQAQPSAQPIIRGRHPPSMRIIPHWRDFFAD